MSLPFTSVKDLKQKVSQIKEKRNGNIISNRIILCIFEVILLWITSLGNVLLLVGVFVPNPDYSFVKDECQSSYELVVSQKTEYKSCTKAQINQCSKSLSSSSTAELKLVESKNLQNANVVKHMTQASTNINTDYDLLVNTLKDLISSNKNLNINFNTFCSVENQSYIENILGDNRLKSSSNIVNSASMYTEISDKRVGRLSDFNIESMAYNFDYIFAKLNNAQEHLNDIEYNISSAYNLTSVDAFKSNLSEAIDCMNISYSGNCKYGKSASKIYGIMVKIFDLKIPHTINLTIF